MFYRIEVLTLYTILNTEDIHLPDNISNINLWKQQKSNSEEGGGNRLGTLYENQTDPARRPANKHDIQKDTKKMRLASS